MESQRGNLKAYLAYTANRGGQTMDKSGANPLTQVGWKTRPSGRRSNQEHRTRETAPTALSRAFILYYKLILLRVNQVIVPVSVGAPEILNIKELNLPFLNNLFGCSDENSGVIEGELPPDHEQEMSLTSNAAAN